MKTITAFLVVVLGTLSLTFAQYSATLTRSDSTSCGPTLTVQFTATVTSGTPVSYEWRFGDGTTSTLQNPTHTYSFSGSGRYYPALYITFTGGVRRAFSFSRNGPIKIGAPDISSMRAWSSVCGPGDHDFYASIPSAFGSANRVSFEWKVSSQNGTVISSNLQSPTLNLPQIGSYHAQLKAWLDPACPDSQSITFNIDSIDFNPVITDASCGNSDGMISVSPSYGNQTLSTQSVSWSTGDSASSISNLSPAFYAASTYYWSPEYQCSDTDTFEVESVGSLTYTITPTSMACEQDSTGEIDIIILSNSGPVTYLWSNGATSQDLTNLAAGTYSVTLSDNNCTYTETIIIEGSSINAAFTAVDADCSGNGGSLEVVPSGGIAPYSYAWSNGVTSSLNANLPVGGYSVVITDASGCADREVAFVEPEDTCFYTLSGKVYYDYNANCVFDGNDVYLRRGWVSLDNGAWYVYIDQQGNYSFEVSPGTYSIGVSNRSLTFASVLCPASGTHNPTVNFSDTNGLDFALAADTTTTDLSLCITDSPIRPGFTHIYGVYINNYGAIPMDGQVSFTHDPLVTLINPPASYDATTRTVTWNYYNFLPGQRRSFSLVGRIDSTVAIGTLITSFATIDPTANDLFPNNNDFQKPSLVVGSFDPNDKQVSPPGEGPEGKIDASENLMLYTIRFQNTGNFPAEFVVLRDTLDAHLDFASIKVDGASHPYSMRMKGNVLEVRFDNINLPDSASDPAGSQGHFAFYIKHDGLLLPNTQITNQAAIYFDFNAPIITNTVVNTIAEPASILESGEASISISPNPSQGIFYIHEKGLEVAQVAVFDLNGRMIYQGNKREIDLSRETPGVYLVHMQTSKGRFVNKVILDR